jgi:hypothetical protein
MGDPTRHHPLTGAPIVPLGFRRDGRAIWPIMGGSDPAPPPSDPPGDPAPTDPPAPPDPPADPPKDPDDGKGGKDAILADLAKERDKRQELEGKLTEQQAQMDAIAKALGLKEDTPPDPEALTAQVEAEQSRAREAALQLAVYRNAAANDANPDALLDSASFLQSIAEVDPTDVTKVGEAIKSALEKNPLLKASPTPTSPPFPGGPRPPAPTGAGSLGEAIANKMAASQNR